MKTINIIKINKGLIKSKDVSLQSKAFLNNILKKYHFSKYGYFYYFNLIHRLNPDLSNFENLNYNIKLSLFNYEIVEKYKNSIANEITKLDEGIISSYKDTVPEHFYSRYELRLLFRNLNNNRKLNLKFRNLYNTEIGIITKNLHTHRVFKNISRTFENIVRPNLIHLKDALKELDKQNDNILNTPITRLNNIMSLHKFIRANYSTNNILQNFKDRKIKYNVEDNYSKNINYNVGSNYSKDIFKNKKINYDVEDNYSKNINYNVGDNYSKSIFKNKNINYDVEDIYSKNINIDNKNSYAKANFSNLVSNLEEFKNYEITGSTVKLINILQDILNRDFNKDYKLNLISENIYKKNLVNVDTLQSWYPKRSNANRYFNNNKLKFVYGNVYNKSLTGVVNSKYYQDKINCGNSKNIFNNGNNLYKLHLENVIEKKLYLRKNISLKNSRWINTILKNVKTANLKNAIIEITKQNDNVLNDHISRFNKNSIASAETKITSLYLENIYLEKKSENNIENSDKSERWYSIKSNIIKFFHSKSELSLILKNIHNSYKLRLPLRNSHNVTISAAPIRSLYIKKVFKNVDRAYHLKNKMIKISKQNDNILNTHITRLNNIISLYKLIQANYSTNNIIQNFKGRKVNYDVEDNYSKNINYNVGSNYSKNIFQNKNINYDIEDNYSKNINYNVESNYSKNIFENKNINYAVEDIYSKNINIDNKNSYAKDSFSNLISNLEEFKNYEITGSTVKLINVLQDILNGNFNEGYKLNLISGNIYKKNSVNNIVNLDTLQPWYPKRSNANRYFNNNKLKFVYGNVYNKSSSGVVNSKYYQDKINCGNSKNILNNINNLYKLYLENVSEKKLYLRKNISLKNSSWINAMLKNGKIANLKNTIIEVTKQNDSILNGCISRFNKNKIALADTKITSLYSENIYLQKKAGNDIENLDKPERWYSIKSNIIRFLHNKSELNLILKNLHNSYKLRFPLRNSHNVTIATPIRNLYINKAFKNIDRTYHLKNKIIKISKQNDNILNTSITRLNNIISLYKLIQANYSKNSIIQNFKGRKVNYDAEDNYSKNINYNVGSNYSKNIFEDKKVNYDVEDNYSKNINYNVGDNYSKNIFEDKKVNYNAEDNYSKNINYNVGSNYSKNMFEDKKVNYDVEDNYSKNINYDVKDIYSKNINIDNKNSYAKDNFSNLVSNLEEFKNYEITGSTVKLINVPQDILNWNFNEGYKLNLISKNIYEKNMVNNIVNINKLQRWYSKINKQNDNILNTFINSFNRNKIALMKKKLTSLYSENLIYKSMKKEIHTKDNSIDGSYYEDNYSGLNNFIFKLDNNRNIGRNRLIKKLEEEQIRLKRIVKEQIEQIKKQNIQEINIKKLSEQVYKNIEDKFKFERQRRGMS